MKRVIRSSVTIVLGALVVSGTAFAQTPDESTERALMAAPRNMKADAFMATSDDAGRSFRNRRLSSSSFDSRVGPVPDDKVGVDFGSRLGISSTDRSTVVAWTDTRRGSEGNGRQDVFTAVVHIRGQDRPWGSVALLGVTAVLALGGAIMTGRTAGPRSRHQERAA